MPFTVQVFITSFLFGNEVFNSIPFINATFVYLLAYGFLLLKEARDVTRLIKMNSEGGPESFTFLFL
jgi:hypothetical protein